MPHSPGKLVVWQVLPWQQPDGQLVASQMQAPPEHRWPAPHGALAPHWHWPPAQVSAFDVSHMVQLPPFVPHVVRFAVWHWFDWQHPLGQLVPSHTHAPFEHRWPAAHCAFEPQRHWPPVHESARPVTQAVHVPPLVPHAARSITLHWFPWQQPDAQLVASQTQAPETQRWPAPHAAFAPQRHAPPAQVSAFEVSHAVHVPPPVPQAVRSISLHWFPWQQPDGQLVESHVHVPPMQRWPAPHAALAPQRHEPPTHESAFVASQAAQVVPAAPQVLAVQVVHWLFWQQPEVQLVASQVHVPPTQRCPCAQAAPLPQAHWPLVQESARASHATHAPAPVPQVAVDGVLQSLPAQQPVAHVCAQPWHTPPWQGEPAQSAHATPFAPQADAVEPG